MKRTGIRLLLVVVLVTTLLLGIVGSAYAAKGYIMIDHASLRLHDDDTSGSYQLDGTAHIFGQRVAYYAVEWCSNHSGSWESVQVLTHELSTPSKSGTLSLSGFDNLSSAFCGDDFYVKVYVTNGRYKLNDHKSYTSSVVTLTCD